MEINWFTVIAQIVNFIILVWLLKRFLYKPILDAIDERESKIASKIDDAEKKDAVAKEEQIEFAHKNEVFDQEKKSLLDKVIAETNKERQKLLESARKEATTLRTKLEKSLAEMQENLNLEIIQKTQNEVFAIARKTLSDLASMDLETQTAKVFIQKLNHLKTAEKADFLKKFKSDSNTILIQSAFELNEQTQSEIKTIVDAILETETQFQFTIAPEIISGIELKSNGFKIAWSISEYLNSLQKSIIEHKQETTKPEIE